MNRYQICTQVSKIESLKERSVNPHKLSWIDQQRVNRQRPPKIVGVLISIFLHDVGIWYLLTQLPPEVKIESPMPGNTGTISITLTKSKPKITPTLVKPRKATSKITQTAPTITTIAPHTIVTPQPDAQKYQQSAEEDFSSHIQAARERRDAAQAEERALAGQRRTPRARTFMYNAAGWLTTKEKSAEFLEYATKRLSAPR